MYKFVRFLIILVQKLCYPCKIYGKENIPKKGRGVIVCNHLYFADPGYFISKVRRKILVLAKKELFNKKFPAWFFTKLNVVPLDRENSSPQILKKTIRTLNSGGLVLLFPEGTRNRKNYELMEFKGGSAIFALMAKAPVIPCVCTKRGGFWKRAVIYIGKPFELTEFYGQKPAKDVCEQATKTIKTEMQKLKNSVDVAIYSIST